MSARGVVTATFRANVAPVFRGVLTFFPNVAPVFRVVSTRLPNVAPVIRSPAPPRPIAAIVLVTVALSTGIAGAATEAHVRDVQPAAKSEQLAQSIPPGATSPRAQANRHPATPDPRLEQRLREAHVLLRTGQPEESLRRLRALRGEYPENWTVVQLLGMVLEAKGDRAEAIRLYRETADRMDPPGPALIELQRVHRESEQWDQALQVCLEYYERLGDRDGWVTNEIESLVRSDGVGAEALSALEAASRRRPDDRTLREILIQGLIYQGRADRAIDEAAALDRAMKRDGQFLLLVSRAALEKRYPAAALAGVDRALRALKGPARDEALFLRAEALQALGRTDESLVAYDAVAESGNAAWAPRARMERARILAADLRRPAEALKAWQAVLPDLDRRTDARSQASAAEARLAMADCHIILGQPAEAGRIYEDLAENAPDPEIRARAFYETGEMLFYQGRLKEAEDTWYRLVDNYSRQRWVNDALERILLVGENSDHGGVPLTAFAQVEYQRRLGELEKALRLADDALSRFPESRAADDLLFVRTTLLLDLGRLDEARASADTLATRFPETLRAPNALLRVADQLARRPDRRTEARELYLMVLFRFPESLDAGLARDGIRELDRTSGSSDRDVPRHEAREQG